MAGILSAEDFKPKKGEALVEVYWIAQAAFRYWRDYRVPIGGMLRTEMLDYCREHKKHVGKRNREKLLDLVENIKHGELVAIEAIEKKVIEYKRRREKSRAIKEMLDLQEKGELDDKTFDKLCKQALRRREELLVIGKYDKDDIDRRIERREKNQEREFPALFIDCLDRSIRTFPRGEYGIILAKYNVGKSTFAIHLAKAYSLQGYNVILYTLEDPIDMVEDRLDASISGIPMKRLLDKSSKLKRRLKRSLTKLRGRIRIVDGTDEGMSVSRMEEVWENFRNEGFIADVVICDYDEGVIPGEHYKGDSGERREMMEVHKSWKKFVAKRKLWGWMLAQTVRGKSGQRKMIVTGDDAAIDISKVKRCGFALGVGDGPEEFGDDGRYLFIAKHRYDKARKGWPIAGDFKRALIYDKELTDEYMQEYNQSKH